MYYRRFFFCILTLTLFFSAGKVYAQSEPPPRLFIGDTERVEREREALTFPSRGANKGVIFIVSPAPGEVIAGGDVKVIIRLPSEITFDEYHVHLWLDTLPAHDNELSVSLEEIPEHTYSNVFSGLHTLYAEAYRNDHTPLDRKMFAEVEFETIGDGIKPAPEDEGQPQTPSASEGGVFIPQGSGNTLFALALIAIFIGLLWYIFGRRNKKA